MKECNGLVLEKGRFLMERERGGVAETLWLRVEASLVTTCASDWYCGSAGVVLAGMPLPRKSERVQLGVV